MHQISDEFGEWASKRQAGRTEAKAGLATKRHEEARKAEPGSTVIAQAMTGRPGLWLLTTQSHGAPRSRNATVEP
ncbi:hypothetical protein DB354_03725 [Opitutus sp. ER46]|nr:hypothetical protein DB354_03725 [Opitutus sp. ER46]